MNALQECLLVSALDDYRQGQISGRQLVLRVEEIAGGEEPAARVLAEAEFSAAELWARDEAPVPQRPKAQAGAAPSGITVSATDPSLSASSVKYPGEVGAITGYLVRPRDRGRHPGVVVIHENKGLIEHIKDVARRLGKAGYVALAPDLLSREGGTDRYADQDELRNALSRIPPESFMADLGASLDYLKGLSYVLPDRLGVVGFCFGGGLAWRMATRRPDLTAAVPFYGPSPPLEEVPNIAAAILALYGELDERINAGVPALEGALKAAGKRYEMVTYPGAKHAFHNDTGPNYHPEAARTAWARTLDHFAQHLKGKG